MKQAPAPARALTVLEVEFPDGTTEWQAFGSGGSHRTALRAAGFRWHPGRRRWVSETEPEVHHLLAARAVLARSSGARLELVA